MKKTKKIVLLSVSSFLAAVLLIAGIFYGLMFYDVNAIFSIKNVRENLYTMNYNGGFYLDRYLAQGGVSSEDELKTFIASHIMLGFGKGTMGSVTPPSGACTSFTATTPDGDKILARNFDAALSDAVILFTNPPDGRYKSVSTVNLGYIGIGGSLSLMNKFVMLSAPYLPIDGMNEKGLAINVNSLYARDNHIDSSTGKINATTTVMMRLVLDYAADVSEAIALFEEYDLHDSINGYFHFQISDRSGDSAIIEFFRGEMKIIRKGSSPYLLQTNFALNETQKAISDEFLAQNPDAEYYPDDYGTNWVIDEFGNNYWLGGGFDRYAVADSKLSSVNGMLSESEAMDLLRSVQIHHLTDWSVVYNLTKLTATITMHANYGGSVYTYKLS